jgi:hypothetical protein
VNRLIIFSAARDTGMYCKCCELATVSFNIWSQMKIWQQQIILPKVGLLLHTEERTEIFKPLYWGMTTVSWLRL